MSEKCPRILIVEDEALLAIELKQKLIKAGYEVVATVTTGEEAVRLAADTSPELMLMDITLAGDMDGIEAARQIRAQTDLPVIYLTVHTDADVVDRAKTTVPSGYLVKPVQSSQLRATIEIALHHHALERELHAANQRLAQAAQQLREQEEKYRVLFESFPLGITISDAAGQVVEANAMAEKLLGLSTATHTQRTIDGPEWQIVRSDGAPMPPEEYASVRALRENHLVENVTTGIVKPDGELAWLNVTAAPIPLENYGVAIAYGDITELKRAEEALRESENRYRELFEHINSGVAVYDVKNDGQDFIFKDFNCAAERIDHDQREQLIGKSIFEVRPGAEQFGLIDVFRKVWRTGEPAYHPITRYQDDRLMGWYENFVYKLPSGEIVAVFENVTERKQVEHELKKTEEQYRLLFTQMTNGFALHEIILDRANHPCDYRFVEINPAFERLTGLRKEQLINHSVRETLPGIEPFWIETYGKVALTGESAFFEHEAGLLQKCYQVLAYSPKKGQFATIFADITDRKQAEKALRENEALLNTTAQIARLGGWELDAQTLELRWTAETYHIHEVPLDYKPSVQEAIDFFHPEDRGKLTDALQRALNTGEPYDLEIRFITAKGKHLWTRTICHPSLVDGKVITLKGIFHDITDRKRAEEALRESEIRFRQLVENIEEVFWVRDLRTGQMLYMSPNYRRIWGFSEQHAYQTSGEFLATVHPEDLQAARAAYQQSAERPVSIEYRIVRPDGDIRWVWVQTFCLRNTTGEAVRQIGIAADITNRKESETELNKYREHLEDLVAERTAEQQEANRQLADEIEERTYIEKELRLAKEAAEQANHEKSAFLANLSHDIRTPLNAILGFTEILKEKLHDQPEYQEFLTRIATGGDNLLRLINDVLDLSKIEAGRVESRSEAVNLRAIQTEMQHLFALKAKEKGLQFITTIDAMLPAAVALDGAHLRQILINLIGNAVKFTEQGSVTLKIETAILPSPLRRGAGGEVSSINLQFSIFDTGVGIAPADIERIFDPFYQATQRFGGTGLGLAISKRLTELMHGTVTVESTPNQGTTFSLVFPEVAAVNPERSPPVAELRQGQFFDFTKATLLLVDDNASNREIICNYLANQPFQLLEAENGQAALDLFNERHPDVILMDIQMPVMDGYEAARQIREAEGRTQKAESRKQKAESRTQKAESSMRKAEGGRQHAEGSESHIPILALTAYALKEQREQFQAIFDDYLTKPIDKPALLTALARFLPHTFVNTSAEKRETLGSLDVESREHQQCLAALRAYLPVSPALQERLHADLLPQYQLCSSIMSIDELLAFAEAIVAAGNEFAVAPLKQYGEQLTLKIKIFQIQEVKRLLALFPEIVDMCNRPP